MSRMTILSSTERQAYETPPIFDDRQRATAFALPEGLAQVAKQMRKPALLVGFILSCVYFTSAKRFFRAQDFHAADIGHVCRLVGAAADVFVAAAYTERSSERHQRTILQFYGYTRFDERAEAFIVKEMAAMAGSHLKPKLMFWRCLDLLARERVQLPSEFRLSALIAAALARRKEQLITRIDELMTPQLRTIIEDLFVQEKADPGEDPGATSRYRLTLLKRLSQSTRMAEVKQRTIDLSLLKDLHDQIFGLLPSLGLGRDGIDYFARSVIRSEIFQLTRRADADRHLHAVAFVAHQYYCLQDNLIDTLLATVQSHQNACLKEIKDLSFEGRRQRDDILARLLKTLDETVFTVERQVRQVIYDDHADDAAKISRLKAIFPANENVAEEPASVAAARQAVKASQENADYYSILESRSLKLQNRISPIVKTLEFKGDGAGELLAAIDYFKARDGLISRSAPHAFLDADEAIAIVKDGQITRISLYKAFLFLHIARALKAGTLNLEHSYKYRSFDDYLISKERWLAEKEALLKRADLEAFVEPQAILAELKTALSAQYAQTNQRISRRREPVLQVKTEKKIPNLDSKTGGGDG